MTAPAADWSKTLEWIEAQARESLRARFVTAELIAKEAQTTLTVFLAGVGGSAAYAAKIFDVGPAGPIEVAAAFVCVYLVILTVSLVVGCMMFQSYPALAQEPANLMQPEYGLDELRQVELENIGKRIKEAAAINESRAYRLNSLRVAAALSPALFAAVAGVLSQHTSEVQPNIEVLCSAPATVSQAPSRLECAVLNRRVTGER